MRSWRKDEAVCDSAKKVFNDVLFIWKSKVFNDCFLKFSSPSSSKKVFNVFLLSKSKGKVSKDLFVFEDKRFQRGSFSSVEKGFRRRLHFGRQKKVNFEDPI